MEKYKSNLIGNASRLNKLLDEENLILDYAEDIVNIESAEATYLLMKKIKEIADSSNYSTESKKIALLLLDDIYKFYGKQKVAEIIKNKAISQDEKTMDDLLGELNSLIGLEKVKTKVNDLIIYQQVQKMRCEYNLHTVKSTLHLAFTGNPGTGKTTVARIVGRLYKQLGLLSKGHFVEVSRTDLIAGYQGQTALKVKKVIEKAKGGVLFIDEAYSITENEHSDSYGRECLTELTKALEDYRNDLVVIVAGYTEPMKVFFEANPGLKSRFNTFIEFDDYTEDELLSILIKICSENDYKLCEKVKEKIKTFFKTSLQEKCKNFANGRFVRNLYENLVMNHAKRVISLPLSKETLSLITEDDFIINSNE